MAHQAFIASRLPGHEPEFYQGNIYSFEGDIFPQPDKVFVVKPFQLSKDFYIVESLKPIGSDEFDYFYHRSPQTQDSRDLYHSVFQKSYHEILSGKGLKKVVLSRTKTIYRPQNMIDYYNTLCDRFPNCFVNLFSSQATGTWIGASPELLFAMTEDSLSTMALAGTKNLQTASWGNKELEEQKFVVNYIQAFFENLNLKYQIKNEFLQMGNIEHLLTKFDIINNSEIWKHLYAFLNEFAPTPAICGYPKELAYHTIIENELYHRDLYSGFWGYIHPQKQANLYVNLRCAQITQSEIIYYAGGGINHGSEEEKEWNETEAKIALLQP